MSYARHSHSAFQPRAPVCSLNWRGVPFHPLTLKVPLVNNAFPTSISPNKLLITLPSTTAYALLKNKSFLLFRKSYQSFISFHVKIFRSNFQPHVFVLWYYNNKEFICLNFTFRQFEVSGNQLTRGTAQKGRGNLANVSGLFLCLWSLAKL